MATTWLLPFYSLLGVSTIAFSSKVSVQQLQTFYSLLGVSAGSCSGFGELFREENFLLPFGSFSYIQTLELANDLILETFYSLLGVSLTA